MKEMTRKHSMALSELSNAKGEIDDLFNSKLNLETKLSKLFSKIGKIEAMFR